MEEVTCYHRLFRTLIYYYMNYISYSGNIEALPIEVTG